MPKNCKKCPFYNDSHYLNNCFIASNGIPSRYAYDANIKPSWCPIKTYKEDKAVAWEEK